MNWYLWFKFITSFSGVPISCFLIYTGLIDFKRSRTKSMLYYILSFAFLALGMLIYSLTPFLIEGQDFFAEITLGGSFIITMLALPVYIEYFHEIYGKVPYISKIFYFTAGSGFTLLFFQPWEILYLNDSYGYSQTISDALVVCVFILFMCIFFIMFQAFRVIKTKVDDEFSDVDQILKESTSNQEPILLVKDRQDNLRSKKRVLNVILLSFFCGICLILVGFIIPESYLDSIGIVVVVAPQAYFFSRDKEIIVYLSAKKVREETKDLQKKLSKLKQQSKVFPKSVEVEIQSMVDFIEKADLILPYRNK